jgi:hypothetical protein
MKEVIADSTNSVQKHHRVVIYNRLMEYVSAAKGDEDALWEMILADYEVFCASQLVNRYGQPFFPSPWQAEDAKAVWEGDYEEYFTFACRRSGKSSWAFTVIIWICARRDYTIVQIYAPTDKQLFIINYIVQNLNKNEYLKYKLINLPYRNHLQKRYVGFKNGSEIDTWSMGMGFTGDSARGGGGNLLVIEEIGLWKRGDLDAVIKPMKREAFGKKIVLYFGTPTLDYNPDLPLEWERAIAMKNTRTRSLTCWNALAEGIRTPEMMMEAFYDFGIPCNIVKESGICPKFLPHLFDDLPEDWECPFNEVCMENDDFVREELIGFPSMSGALFTRDLVGRSMYDNFGLQAYPDRGEGKIYAMGADNALLMDYTQILVGELFNKLCDDNIVRPAVRVIYWVQVNPEDIEGADPYPVVDAYKTTNRIWQPKWILADGSSTGATINFLCTKGDTPIPKTRFVRNQGEDTPDHKIVYGLVWGGEFKDLMFKNLKNQMLWGTVEMPLVQPFANKMMDELTSLESKSIATGRYNQIVARRGKKKDLASALAMLAWILHEKNLIRKTRTIGVSLPTREVAPVGNLAQTMRQKYPDRDPFTFPKKRAGKTTKIGGVGAIGMSKAKERKR